MSIAPARIALFLPALEGGGAERVFVELANEFAALGLRVDLVLACAHGPYLGELSAAVRVIDLNASGVLNSLPKLIRYLRSQRPQTLLSGLDHANITAVLARFASGSTTRCVVSMRSVPTVVYGQAGSWGASLMLKLMKFTYPRADAIITNSEAVAAGFSILLGARPDHLRVVYNPLNIRRIEELSCRDVDHAWCSPGAAPVVLGVGSLTAFKDFPTLIRAFSQVRAQRDCRLMILGEGPERAKIEAMIREQRLQHDVQVPGFVSNPFAWMRRARVFVSSSLTEGCPNALMQALACGTQVVSTDCVGGSAEILQEGKWGHLVKVGDAQAMAHAIVAALDAVNPVDVRQRAADFAHDRIARQYLKVLLPDTAAPAPQY